MAGENEQPPPVAPAEEKLHFCYERPLGSHLCQGDLLERTPALDALLQKVHPHYHETTNYRRFLVLTQSCDMVRRDGACKTRYITIAGVRPLSLVLARELDSCCSPLERAAGIAKQGTRGSIIESLRRILNNNDTRYFYLHTDSALGITEPMCAFLHLSVALRAPEHYQLCMESRLASLTDVFQAKLGWLVGNLYSRVGTPDWVPAVEGEPAFTKRLSAIVEPLAIWVEDKKIDAAKKAREAAPAEWDLPADQLRRKVSDMKVVGRREKVTNALNRALQDRSVLGDRVLSQKEVNDILRYLASDSEYKTAVA